LCDKDKVQSEPNGDDDMEATDEIYYSVSESIEESLKQVKEFKEGKREFKSIEKSLIGWDEWAKDVENEFNKEKTDIKTGIIDNQYKI